MRVRTASVVYEVKRKRRGLSHVWIAAGGEKGPQIGLCAGVRDFSKRKGSCELDACVAILKAGSQGGHRAPVM